MPTVPTRPPGTLIPDHFGPYVGLARVAVLRGALDEALEAVKDAAVRGPREPTVWFTTAEVHRARRDFEAAVANYTKAIELEPRHFAARPEPRGGADRPRARC